MKILLENRKNIKRRRFVLPTKNSYSLLEKYFETDLYTYKRIVVWTTIRKFIPQILEMYQRWARDDPLEWPGWDHIRWAMDKHPPKEKEIYAIECTRKPDPDGSKSWSR